MEINTQTALATGIILWASIKKWIDTLSKIIEPIIVEIEKMSKDGKIDRKERKALAMKAISLLEAQGKIKLNIFSKMILSKVVDIVAKRLPDFTISKEASEAINGVV